MEPHTEEPQYPEEYSHLRDEVNGRAEQIQGIDTQIAYWEQRPKGEVISPPAFKPVVGPSIRQETSEDRIKSLKGQREQIQLETFEKVEQAIVREPDPQKQRLVRNISREKLFGNEFKEGEFKDLTEQQLQAAKAKHPPLSLEKSQDFMDALRERRLPEPPPYPPGNVPEQASFPAPPYNVSVSLTYMPPTDTVQVREGNETLDRVEAKDQGDVKPLSIAERALQTLNYTQLSQGTTPTLDHTPEPEKAPELEVGDDGPEITP
jgi:hypothetical protein